MPAGRLAMDGGLAQLEWSRDVLATRLPVAGLYYPPEPGLQAARGRAFDGLRLARDLTADNPTSGVDGNTQRRRDGH